MSWPASPLAALSTNPPRPQPKAPTPDLGPLPAPLDTLSAESRAWIEWAIAHPDQVPGALRDASHAHIDNTREREQARAAFMFGDRLRRAS